MGSSNARGFYRSFIESHKYFFPENARILDCGAGNGSFSVPAVKMAHAGRVFSYDGYFRNFNQILENVRNNSLYNIVPDDHHILGSTGRYSVHVKNGIVNTVEEGERILVESRKVDELVLPRLDLIKVTVPGAAVSIINGATRRIESDKPSIIAEVISDKEGRELVKLMDGLGMDHDSTVDFSSLEKTGGKLLIFSHR